MNSLIILNLLFVALSSATPTNLAKAPPIVGGFLANKNEFPHQVALTVYGYIRCGGSIISEHFVLTAAHCLVSKTQLKSFDVLVGVNNLDDENGQRYKVVDQIPHEKYSPFEHKDDIGLLRLEKPIIYSESVKPIELQTTELELNSKVRIIGWGRTGSYEEPSRDLKYNIVSVDSNTVCGKINYKGLICLGHPKDNGACNGDSGGSAISQDGKLIGVANFVVESCGSTNPDGYAKVSFYKNWIESKMDKFEEKKTTKKLQILLL
jgi:secreted trypsin-like serine protease